MFRQRRKHRFEQLEIVRERTEGMTVRDLESHLHFYRVLDKWTGDNPIASDFFSAWERVIKEAKQKVSKPKKPKLDAIKKLINQLDKLDKSVLKEVVEVGLDNRINFKTALQTTRTAQGIKIGGYLIKINYTGKRQSYDVIRLKDNKDIVLDVKLYEMAFCLVKYLNDNVISTDPRMVELHEIYSDYTIFSDKATQYKRRYYDAVKEGNNARQLKNTEEFEKNRDFALEYKAKIIELFKKNTA
tara:strand:+ start:2824 stop:3552 length:729 start_codon:yes stop_codon:yes gene_type:complete